MEIDVLLGVEALFHADVEGRELDVRNEAYRKAYGFAFREGGARGRGNKEEDRRGNALELFFHESSFPASGRLFFSTVFQDFFRSRGVWSRF